MATESNTMNPPAVCSCNDTSEQLGFCLAQIQSGRPDAEHVCRYRIERAVELLMWAGHLKRAAALIDVLDEADAPFEDLCEEEEDHSHLSEDDILTHEIGQGEGPVDFNCYWDGGAD